MTRYVTLTLALLATALCLNVSAGTVTSKWDLDLYGYLKLDAVYDTQRTVDGDIMLWVLPEAADGKDNEFNMSVWESRFGFNIKGPLMENIKATGKLEAGFYGRVNLKGNDGKPPPHKPLLRLRLAYADLAYDTWSLRIGQDWDTFITVIPKSVNFTYFGEQGAPGYRRPQVRVSKVMEMDDYKLTAKAGIARTLGEDLDRNGQDDGVDSGIPTAEGNLILETPFFAEQKLKLSVSGEYGTETIDAMSTNVPSAVTEVDAKDFESWLIMGSISMPIGKKLALQGAVWQGKNLDTYEAGILQGVNMALKTEIAAKGGWAQLMYNPTAKLNVNVGYGLDDPDDEDLSAGNRSKNEFPMASVWYKLNDAMTFAFEYSHLMTSYKDGDTADNDRFHGAMYYYF